MTTDWPKLNLDKADPGTLAYIQLAKYIQGMIENRTLSAGDLAPSERKLAAHCETSPATVRRAYEVLVQKGFLTRVHGKGTFVTSTAQRRKHTRYYPYAQSLHDEVKHLEANLISLEKIPGRKEINRPLEIGGKQELYQLKRTLLDGEQTLVYAISFYPVSLFPNLEDYEESYLKTTSTHIFFEEIYNISTINYTELTGIALADSECSKIMQVALNHPLLEISKLIYTHKKKPYEYRKSYCRADTARLKREF